MKKIVILISGRGSNLAAILEAQQVRAWEAEVVHVICNQPDAPGIAIAEKFGVPVTIIDHKSFSNRSLFDEALLEKTRNLEPDLVVLAGYMRILSSDFVQQFNRRLINIHPSLLPSFPGLNTHRAALIAGVKWHGATVHFVTEDLDVGPIIAQGVVPVLQNDTEEILASRVFVIEHLIYPQAIEWFIREQLVLEQGNVRVDPTQQQFFMLPTTPEGIIHSNDE
jgi:phosphoribosylglycinamide formyltransferase-1